MVGSSEWPLYYLQDFSPIPRSLEPTRQNPLTPSSEPSLTPLDLNAKDPSAWCLRGLYGRHVRVWPQRNIWREVWSGFCWMLVMNSTMARLIKSNSLIRYRSQMVVMSSLRVSGILKQVWYGCLVIGNSFRHSGFWRSLDSPYPVFVPL